MNVKCSDFHWAALSGFPDAGVKTAHSLVSIWANAWTTAASLHQFHLPFSLLSSSQVA